MIFDAHCDTISKMAEGKEGSLLSNPFEVDINRIAFTPYAQIFAVFIPHKTSTPYKYCNSLIDCFDAQIAANSIQVEFCRSVPEITAAWKRKKCAALLSIEGGEALEGNLDNLRRFYDRGVRLLTLTWNYRNELGDGILEKKGLGLTEFGRQVVVEMNDLGIAVDVSHLSERGFWDVAEISAKPLLASHSDCRALCGHPRNLTDEQIKAVIAGGGCIGINFCPDFLCDDGNAAVEDILRHADHIISLGGEDSVGFGTDFDGIDELPCGISGVQDMALVVDALRKRYNREQADKITHGNFLRVLGETIK